MSDAKRTTVFVVFESSDYEQDNIMGIFYTEADALKHAQEVYPNSDITWLSCTNIREELLWGTPDE
jgi:hypothetical protein